MSWSRVSIPGAVLAGLYLLPSLAVLVISIDCVREGCGLLIVVTFPWILLFLNTSAVVLPALVCIVLNATSWYLVGALAGYAVKRWRSRS